MHTFMPASCDAERRLAGLNQAPTQALGLPAPVLAPQKKTVATCFYLGKFWRDTHSAPAALLLSRGRKWWAPR